MWHVYDKMDGRKNNNIQCSKCTIVGQLQHLFEVLPSKLKPVIDHVTLIHSNCCSLKDMRKCTPTAICIIKVYNLFSNLLLTLQFSIMGDLNQLVYANGEPHLQFHHSEAIASSKMRLDSQLFFLLLTQPYSSQASDCGLIFQLHCICPPLYKILLDLTLPCLFHCIS